MIVSLTKLTRNKPPSNPFYDLADDRPYKILQPLLVCIG